MTGPARRLAINDPDKRREFMEYLDHAKARPQLAADGFTVCWFDAENVIPLDLAFFHDEPWPEPVIDDMPPRCGCGEATCGGCGHPDDCGAQVSR